VTAGTTNAVTWQNCYANHSTGYGYKLRLTYSNLSGCACDNNAAGGYYFYSSGGGGSQGVTMSSCGAEANGGNSIHIVDGNRITLIDVINSTSAGVDGLRADTTEGLTLINCTLTGGTGWAIRNTGCTSFTRIGTYVNAAGLGTISDPTTLMSINVAGTGGIQSPAAALTGTQLVSTVATGTPPLAVTSTTKVSNLDVDKCDGQDLGATDGPTHDHMHITHTVSAEVQGIEIKNLQPGGYGSAINFWAQQSGAGTTKASARIAAVGAGPWSDDANSATDLVFYTILAGTLAARARISAAGNLKIGANQVVGARVVDARCDDAINSGDATTDGVIDSLRDAMIAHGLIAAA
jgi:hypothetical protein